MNALVTSDFESVGSRPNHLGIGFGADVTVGTSPPGCDLVQTSLRALELWGRTEINRTFYPHHVIYRNITQQNSHYYLLSAAKLEALDFPPVYSGITDPYVKKRLRIQI